MKLIATIVATLALLFGGTVTLAPAAMAVDKNGCDPTGVCEPVPCKPSACGEPGGSCSESGSCNAQPPTVEPVTCEPDATIDDYRVMISFLKSRLSVAERRVERLERVADRRAATIRRLRQRLAAAR